MKMERIPLWPGRDDVALNVYVTPPDPAWPFPTPTRPGMLVCPGGAYLDLSPAEGEPLALDFACHGYQAFVLEYTVATKAPKTVDRRYPAQLIDLAKAISVIRENAGHWNLDADKLAIMGFSAGGHLCASYAVHWHEDWLAQAVGTDSQILRPQAAVLGYPITDYVLQEFSFDPPTPMMRASNRTVFGATQPTEEQLRQLSPCLYVSDQTPPTYLVHAADDGMVPVENSLRMAQALAQAGIPFELHIFQQGEHGFGAGHSMDTPWKTHTDRACSAWLPLSRTWLLKQFAPETVEAPLPDAEEFFRAKEQQQSL